MQEAGLAGSSGEAVLLTRGSVGSWGMPRGGGAWAASGGSGGEMVPRDGYIALVSLERRAGVGPLHVDGRPCQLTVATAWNRGTCQSSGASSRRPQPGKGKSHHDGHCKNGRLNLAVTTCGWPPAAGFSESDSKPILFSVKIRITSWLCPVAGESSAAARSQDESGGRRG